MAEDRNLGFSPAPGGRVASWFYRYEGPTWLVAVAVYAGWSATTYLHARLPWYALLLLGAWFVAWHGSLQHETIHNHPRGPRWVGMLLGSLPLSLWLPYSIYREQHLTHHRMTTLTEPGTDPESFYVSPEAWARRGAFGRGVLVVHQTLLGRMVLGPALGAARFLADEVRGFARGERRHVRAWLEHAAGLVLVGAWLLFVCRMSLLEYVVFFVYPGASLTLVRSYFEHRATAVPAARTAVVESGFFFSLLFLNNNLHSAHHARPALPWYSLPRLYKSTKPELLAANGGFVLRGYTLAALKHLVRPVDTPVHPLAPRPE